MPKQNEPLVRMYSNSQTIANLQENGPKLDAPIRPQSTKSRRGRIVKTARGRKFQPAIEPVEKRTKVVYFEGKRYFINPDVI